MLIENYRLLVVLATLASYLAIVRPQTFLLEELQDSSGYYVTAMFAIVCYVLLAIASWNIEVVSNGEPVGTTNEYLFLLWAGMAGVNLLFLVYGSFEALAEALEDATDGVAAGSSSDQARGGARGGSGRDSGRERRSRRF